MSGIDAVLIGPSDLSTSLDIPEEYSHPEFDKAVRFIIETVWAKGIGVGIHYWANIEQEIDWARHGANMIVHHGDITLFTSALREDLNHMREALGDQAAPTVSRDVEHI